jgi:hypothetical protein
MLKLILLSCTVALITTTAGAQDITTEQPEQPKTPAEVHLKRTGATAYIDMYPGMIRRWVAPVAIKHVHIGDQGLVFVQQGETDHVVYIGACKKAGGNTGGNTTGGKAGSVNVNGDKAGDEASDNTCDKVGGETNVILVDANDKEIANILITAWPPSVREDEGKSLVRILREGRYTPYWVPTWMPQPRIRNRPRLNNSGF